MRSEWSIIWRVLFLLYWPVMIVAVKHFIIDHKISVKLERRWFSEIDRRDSNRNRWLSAVFMGGAIAAMLFFVGYELMELICPCLSA